MLCYVVGWGGVQQRSCNLRGRGCNVLAVHYPNKKPGLESVVKALERFRQLEMKSCRQPTLVFKEAPWDGWNRKNSWLTALGNFDDMQKHWEFLMKNHITSKYQWKHSTLCPFPMIFDISLNVHLVIPMGKKEHTQKKVVMVHLRLQLRRTRNFWSVIERHQTWNELHQTSPFYHSKTLFFSNSMILIDVLSENLLPLPYMYIYNIYKSHTYMGRIYDHAIVYVLYI